MFGYNAQFKRCAIDGAKTLRVQRLSATTGVNVRYIPENLRGEHIFCLHIINYFIKHYNFRIKDKTNKRLI